MIGSKIDFIKLFFISRTDNYILRNKVAIFICIKMIFIATCATFVTYICLDTFMTRSHICERAISAQDVSASRIQNHFTSAIFGMVEIVLLMGEYRFIESLSHLLMGNSHIVLIVYLTVNNYYCICAPGFTDWGCKRTLDKSVSQIY